MIPPRIRGRPLRPLIGRQGPFRGVRDSLDPTGRDPTLALRMRNLVIPSPETGSSVEGRPGFRPAGTASAGEVQWMGQLTLVDGSELTLRIRDGEIDEYSWTADAWTTRISQDDLTGAGITLATTGLVHAFTFADLLIVTDGVNVPFGWDGSPGGGLTAFSNVPPLYGPPTIYYGRIFGIKAADRITIAWSEPAQPDVGWEDTGSGFNNAWELRQTDQSPIYALVGTNEALYYFRARSIGAVLGAVDTEFRTTGTHEAVSETVGTISPYAVCVAEGSIWFLDSDGQPQRLVIGGGLQHPAPWLDARETLRGQDLGYLPRAQAVYRPDIRCVLFLVASPGSQVLDRLLCYHAPTGQYMGFWDFPVAPTRIGIVKDAETAPRDAQAGQGEITQADAVRQQDGDCGTSAPMQVGITYSTSSVQQGDTVTIEESISGSPFAPVAAGFPVGTARHYTRSIPGREYNADGTPETRRYRVRLLAEDGVERGVMETGPVDTSYDECAPPPPPPQIGNAQATRVANGDCVDEEPMRVRVQYSTSGTDVGDSVRVDVSVNGGSYVQLASGLAVGSGFTDDVIPDREFSPSGTQETRRYRIRIVGSDGQVRAQAETGIVATHYVVCGAIDPQITQAVAARIADGSCPLRSDSFSIPGIGPTVEIVYTTTGTGNGHTVAIDESIDGGAYSEVRSGLATGSALVAALVFPAGRTYDAAGTPETRKYRVRIVDENGATVAQAETSAVDTSYVLCPDLAAASATRIDGSCNVQQGFGVPMRVRLLYTVSASDAGDTIVIDRRVNGGSYSVAASFAAPGTGTWDDELTGTYYDPDGTPETRQYRVRIERGGQTLAQRETAVIDTTASVCNLPSDPV